MRVHTPWITFPWSLQVRDRRTSDMPYPNVWLLPQARTEAILRARFVELGGMVELATELVSFEHDAAGVTATLKRDGALEPATGLEALSGCQRASTLSSHGTSAGRSPSAWKRAAQSSSVSRSKSLVTCS